MSNTLERLSTAMVSGDLSPKETRCDVDWMHALGAVGNSNPKASALLRVELAGDAVSFECALAVATILTRKLNDKRKWGMLRTDLREIIDKAIEMWLAPTCRRCYGTKYQVISGTPVLSATPCGLCHGTGKQPYPIKNSRKISEVVHSLTAIRDIAEGAVTAKMK